MTAYSQLNHLKNLAYRTLLNQSHDHLALGETESIFLMGMEKISNSSENMFLLIEVKFKVSKYYIFTNSSDRYPCLSKKKKKRFFMCSVVFHLLVNIIEYYCSLSMLYWGGKKAYLQLTLSCQRIKVMFLDLWCGLLFSQDLFPNQ